MSRRRQAEPHKRIKYITNLLTGKMVPEIEPANQQTPSLPAKFHEMSPHDKARALQTYILQFLEDRDHATPADLGQMLPEVTPESIRRQLRVLAGEQSIYEIFIGNVPMYRKNGTLAHHTLQRHLAAGKVAFSMRTYGDRQTGQAVTITEYHVSPLGTRRATNGIRIPLDHLGAFLQILSDIQASIKADPGKLEGNLRPGNP
jgi:hypothetical protein